MIIVTFVVFISRNINRINYEVGFYDYDIKSNIFHRINKDHFRLKNKFSNLLKNYENCLVDKGKCIDDKVFKVNKKYGKYIFIKK